MFSTSIILRAASRLACGLAFHPEAHLQRFDVQVRLASLNPFWRQIFRLVRPMGSRSPEAV
jgi:hypothetical protein